MYSVYRRYADETLDLVMLTNDFCETLEVSFDDDADGYMPPDLYCVRMDTDALVWYVCTSRARWHAPDGRRVDMDIYEVPANLKCLMDFIQREPITRVSVAYAHLLDRVPHNMFVGLEELYIESAASSARSVETWLSRWPVGISKPFIGGLERRRYAHEQLRFGHAAHVWVPSNVRVTDDACVQMCLRV